MKDIADLIGRILIAFIFLYEAYDSIFYFNVTKDQMTASGLTWSQDVLLTGSIFVLILGGVLILLGYRSSLGAILILLYWIPVTFILHSWWNDPIEIKREEAIAFMKNIAIMGGLLMLIANGSGKYSIKKLFATTKVRGT